MEHYRYKAQDEKGKSINGVISAVDEFDLQSKLKADGKMLISYKIESNKVTYKKLTSNQVSEFCRNVGELLGAGVTLVRALRIISEDEAINIKQRELYAAVLKDVRAGIAFSDSMQNQGDAFPALLINMIRSAESSGNLDKISVQMASYYDKEYRLSQKVKSSMTYPKILCVMIVAVVAIIMGYVIPQFKSLFDAMDSLPITTTILLAISNFVKDRWYILIFLAFCLYMLYRVLISIPQVKYFIDKMEVKLPKIGRLRKVIYTARFARTLSSLYSAGIPITNCLQIAKNTIGNKYIESQFDDLVHAIRNGDSLSEAIDRVDGFTKKLSSSIMVGEETGAMDNMLTSIADQMEYDSEMALNRLVAYLEPVMIVVMAVIVGFIMIAVIQPIYGSYEQIAAQ
ncbi:MAG: type II secretion system F family protein [Lachnospiraceae bacterium]|nr:type II secretion system F family protein [Lachnospiraceae bacterium]